MLTSNTGATLDELQQLLQRRLLFLLLIHLRASTSIWLLSKVPSRQSIMDTNAATGHMAGHARGARNSWVLPSTAARQHASRSRETVQDWGLELLVAMQSSLPRPED